MDSAGDDQAAGSRAALSGGEERSVDSCRDGGLQIGVVNIVRDNPKGLQVLPVFNTRF